MLFIVNALKLLADDTRLRILRLVAREPLNVSELTAILGLAQSGISRHLSLLRKAGLVTERREGVWTYYELAAEIGLKGENGRGEEADSSLLQIWTFVREKLAEAEDPFHDLPRLMEALRQRENYGGGLNEKLLEPGQSWFAWSRTLHYLLPPVDALDLGCGDGIITVEISRFARRVVGIDVNPRFLMAARQRAERERRKNVSFKEDRIEALQEPDEDYDLVVFSQSLHHLKEPERGIGHAIRVLRPGGRLVVFDLAPHQEQWVIPKLGHVHLGFELETLRNMLRGQGLTGIELEQVQQRRGEVFRVVLATGIKGQLDTERLLISDASKNDGKKGV